MTEGEILHYFIEVGDEVAVDQPLVEIQTDKMVAEIPSPVAGKVTAIHFEPGETVTVGTTMIEIDDGKTKGKSEPKKEKIVEEKTSTPLNNIVEPYSAEKRINNVKAAPYTRKIARELGVDIEQITGTGKG